MASIRSLHPARTTACSSASPSTGTASSSVIFDALTPDRVALQLDYALDEGLVAANVASSGSVYLPIGASGGLGEGLYVLAAPSRAKSMVFRRARGQPGRQCAAK